MTDKTKKKQKPEHLFKPGQSGNPKGRPKGARNKLGEEFIQALADDFAEYGVETLQKVREEKPDVYIKTIASLMPKNINLDATIKDANLNDIDRASRIAAILDAARERATGQPLESGSVGSPARAADGSKVH